MIKHILPFAGILISIFARSQTLELDTHKKKLSDFLKLETTLGSERLENKSQFISESGVAQPIQFRRKEKDIPDLIVYYFYFRNDSAIDYIRYEWDDSDSKEPEKRSKKTPKEINAFIDKYNDLFSQISKAFGKSESEGNLTDLSKIETGDFQKQDVWKPDDSTKIDLSIYLSSKYESNGPVSDVPAYRIRLYCYNLTKPKNESSLQKPDEKKVKELDSVLTVFMSHLKNDDLEKARLSLPSSAAGKVTNEQLEKLRQNIKFEDPLLVYFSGIQMALDGSSYLILQYKYASDNNHPPKELIKVIFNDKNEILGIQPSMRQ
jgi:hypothetical protein